ncbi:MAG: hypothetical protein ACHQQQ_09310 [Bacteroidota bacterium]
MKFRLIFIFLIAICFVLTETVRAQQISGRISTSVYGFQTYDTVKVPNTIARGIQTLQLYVSQNNLSLQTYLTGSMNLDEPGNFSNLRARNLFLQWKNVTNGVDLSLGRIPVFAGVGVGAVDGALFRVKTMEDKVYCVVYGGANVGPDSKSTGTNNLSQNYFTGGQVIGTMLPNTRISLSYMNRNIERQSYLALRPDSLYNPVSVLIQPDSRAQQTAGVDARYSVSENFYSYGRFDYDLNLNRTLRSELKSRLAVTSELAFTGDFIYREPQIDYNSIFIIFPLSPIRELEGGVEYIFPYSIRTYGRIGYVKYVDDQSRRLSIGATSEYAAISYSGTNGYAGELSSFDLQGMYPLFERKLIPSVGMSFSSVRYDYYDPSPQHIFANSLGFVWRPLPTFSFNMQSQWLRTPVATNDVRYLGTINYWFSDKLHLFSGKEGGK